MNAKRHQLIADNANLVLEDDAFQRYPFAKQIAKAISEYTSKESFVTSIYGKWGEGKTTVLNFLKHLLDQKDNHVVVEFNPWMYANEKEMLLGFLQLISRVLGVNQKNTGSKLAEALNEYSALLGMLGKATGIPISGDAIRNIGAKLSDRSTGKVKAQINSLLTHSGYKFVFILDDIDRLSLVEIQAVFKLIKILADFHHTRYILSFDPDIVSRALSPVFPNGGETYLEKIIQLPLTLPKAQSYALYRFIWTTTKRHLESNDIKLNDDDLERFRDTFNQYLLPYIDNPRFAIRYANTISFSLPMLKGEVNIVDLLLIEAIKVLLPDLYSFMREQSGLLVRNFSVEIGASKKEKDEERKEIIALFINGISEHKKRAYKNLLSLMFPLLSKQHHSSLTDNQVWRDYYQNKMICSAKYVERYFTYAVIKGDLSDIVFDEVIEKLVEKDFDGDKEELYQIVSEFDSWDFIFKLELLKGKYNTQIISTLAENLCILHSAYPDPNENLWKTDVFFFLSGFLVDSVKVQDEDKRLSLAISLILRAQPYQLAFEVWIQLRYREKHKLILDENELVILRTQLIERIRNRHNFYEARHELTDLHYGEYLKIFREQDKEFMQKELNKFLVEKEDFFIKLLYAHTSTIHSSGGIEGPISFKSAYTKEYYDRLSKNLDVELFFDMSLKKYGDQSENLPETEREVLPDEVLVGTFQFIHKNPDKSIPWRQF